MEIWKEGTQAVQSQEVLQSQVAFRLLKSLWLSLCTLINIWSFPELNTNATDTQHLTRLLRDQAVEVVASEAGFNCTESEGVRWLPSIMPAVLPALLHSSGKFLGQGAGKCLFTPLSLQKASSSADDLARRGWWYGMAEQKPDDRELERRGGWWWGEGNAEKTYTGSESSDDLTTCGNSELGFQRLCQCVASGMCVCSETETRDTAGGSLRLSFLSTGVSCWWQLQAFLLVVAA